MADMGRSKLMFLSAPYEAVETTCRSTAIIAVFRNVFSIVVSTKVLGTFKKTVKLTFNLFQKWIEDNYKINVRKSSIPQVNNKCTISSC